MPLQPTTHIWHNGQLIPWENATTHVMSHVIHYGSSVFEGIRCYTQGADKAAIFRLPEHMRRMQDSAKIYRMPLPYTLDQLQDAVVELVEANGVAPCYIRPFAFRGYGEMGVNGLKANRLAPNTMPSLAKAGANYMNSQLIRMEADINGYVEGIALDRNGYLSEGSGENLFIIRNDTLYTSPLANSVLNGITRDSILVLARQFGIPVVEQPLPREFLYICDEAFFTGTAAEVSHLRSVDRIMVGDGTMGPVTRMLHDAFFAIVNGEVPDRYNWLTPVKVARHDAVGETINA